MGSSHDVGMDTPLRPLPDPRVGGRGQRDPGEAPPRGRLRTALQAALGHLCLSWRALLFVLAVQLLLGLTVIVPLHAGLAESLDHHAHASALAGAPDAHDLELGWEAGMHPGVWRDLGREQEALLAALPLALFWICVTAWVFGAFAAGGFLGTYGAARIRLGAFVEQGGRRFFPMLRVGVLFALSYYVLGRLVLEVWAQSVASDEFMAASQGVGWWGERVREGVMVLGFLWLRLAGDSARAQLVASDRRGALRAFLTGMLRACSPRRWVLALALGVPAFGLLLLLAPLLGLLGGGSALALLGGFVLIQVAVLLRWSSRAAVLGGLLSLEHSRPARG